MKSRKAGAGIKHTNLKGGTPTEFDISRELLILDSGPMQMLFYPGFFGEANLVRYERLLDKSRPTIFEQINNLFYIDFFKSRKKGRTVFVTFNPSGKYLRKFIMRHAFPCVVLGYSKEEICDIAALIDSIIKIPSIQARTREEILSHNERGRKARHIYYQEGYSRKDKAEYRDIFKTPEAFSLRLEIIAQRYSRDMASGHLLKTLTKEERKENQHIFEGLKKYVEKSRDISTKYGLDYLP